MNLHSLGWNRFFEQQFNIIDIDKADPARIAMQHRTHYELIGAFGTLPGVVTGAFRHRTEPASGYPAVGDWVVATLEDNGAKAMIHAVLDRVSVFSRSGVTGGPRTEEQVAASNVDTVFLVSGLDSEFKQSRLERYLTAAWDSGATPVVVLNKADLCDNLEAVLNDVQQAAIGIDVHTVSARNGDGIDDLRQYFTEGRTVALLGSSGVGKSSIINCLLGEDRQAVTEVSDEASRGRHTTTARELIVLPDGGIIIDTPGMREFAPWRDDGSLQQTFGDIDALAEQCRFTDCRHVNEPGCAVSEALRSGLLDQRRLENYRKLQRELAYLERRKDIAAQRRETRVWTKRIRTFQKERKKLSPEYRKKLK